MTEDGFPVRSAGRFLRAWTPILLGLPGVEGFRLHIAAGLPNFDREDLEPWGYACLEGGLPADVPERILRDVAAGRSGPLGGLPGGPWNGSQSRQEHGFVLHVRPLRRPFAERGNPTEGGGPVAVLSLRVASGTFVEPPQLGSLVDALASAVDVFLAARAEALRICELESTLGDTRADLWRTRRRNSRIDLVRDALLGPLGHDVQNPIAVILGAAQTLEEEILGPLGARQKASVAMIRRQAERLGAELADLVDRRRAGEGRVPPALEPLDLGELVKGVVARLVWVAEKRQQTLSTEIESSVEVDGDTASLEEAMGSLVSHLLLKTGDGGALKVVVTADLADAVLRVFAGAPARGVAPDKSDAHDMRLALDTFVAHDARLQIQAPPGGKTGTPREESMEPGLSAELRIPLSSGVGSRLDVLVASAVPGRIEEIAAALGPFFSFRSARAQLELAVQLASGLPAILVVETEDRTLSTAQEAPEEPPDFSSVLKGLPPIPTILVTPAGSELTSSVHAVTILHPPLDLSRLAREIRALGRTSSGARAAARRDPVTGLLWNDMAEADLRRIEFECKAAGVPLSAVTLILDGLEVVEKHAGPAGPDEILQWFAQRLRDEAPHGNLLLRLRDRGFLVILPFLDEQEALDWASTLQTRIQETSPRIGALRVQMGQKMFVSALCQRGTFLSSGRGSGAGEAR
jgi:GGDEF domain-containing protein